MKPEGSFADPAVRHRPFPLIHQIRAEAADNRDAASEIYVVFRYDDISNVKDGPPLLSNRRTVVIGGDGSAPDAAQLARLCEVWEFVAQPSRE